MAAVWTTPGVLFILWGSVTLGFGTPGISDAREIGDTGRFTVSRVMALGKLRRQGIINTGEWGWRGLGMAEVRDTGGDGDTGDWRCWGIW